MFSTPSPATRARSTVRLPIRPSIRLTTTEFLVLTDIEYDEPSLVPVDCA